jgi:chromosome segregation ATPase
MKKIFLTSFLPLLFSNIIMAGHWPHVGSVIHTIAKAATAPVQITTKTVTQSVTAVAKKGDPITKAVVNTAGDIIVKPSVDAAGKIIAVTAKGGEIILIKPAEVVVHTVQKTVNMQTITNTVNAVKSGINSLNDLKTMVSKLPADANKDVDKINDAINHALGDLNIVLDKYAQIQQEIDKIDPVQNMIDKLQNDAQNEIDHVNLDLKKIKELSDDAGIVETIGEIAG